MRSLSPDISNQRRSTRKKSTTPPALPTPTPTRISVKESTIKNKKKNNNNNKKVSLNKIVPKNGPSSSKVGNRSAVDELQEILSKVPVAPVAQVPTKVPDQDKPKSSKKKRHCAMIGCTSQSLPLAKSYHKIPSRDPVWKHWVHALQWSRNNPDWLPEAGKLVVCSRHFQETDFITYKNDPRPRTCLIPLAVPQLYIDPPMEMSQDGKKMKVKMNPKFKIPLDQRLPSLAQFRGVDASNIAETGIAKKSKNATATTTSEQMMMMTDSDDDAGPPFLSPQVPPPNPVGGNSYINVFPVNVELQPSLSVMNDNGDIEVYMDEMNKIQKIDGTSIGYSDDCYFIPQGFGNFWTTPVDSPTSSSEMEIVIPIDEQGQSSSSSKINVKLTTCTLIMNALEGEINRLAVDLNLPYDVIYAVWTLKHLLNGQEFQNNSTMDVIQLE